MSTKTIAEPRLAAAFIISTPATIGPPKSAEMEENEAAVASTASGGQRHAGAAGNRCRRRAEPFERLMTAVSGRERASDHDHARTHHRQADDEIPLGRRRSESAGQVLPEPVLGLVHECQRERRELCGGNADHRRDQHNPQIRPAGNPLEGGTLTHARPIVSHGRTGGDTVRGHAPGGSHVTKADDE
jgi:hypothetical protein